MNNFKRNSKSVMWIPALLASAILAGCGGSGSGVAASGSSAASGPAGAVCSGAGCVNLGTAGNYAILAKTGVATAPISVVTGNVGVSPASRTFLTGWSQTADVTDTYATSAQVAAPGKLYAADNVGGTTSVDLTTAIGDMQTAYTNANGLATSGGGLVPGPACPGVGALGGQTITPGVYTCGVALDITGTLTFNGAGVYVIKTTGGFTTAVGANVVLAGGALAQNIFWVIAGATSTGATSHLEGIILDQTAITMGSGSSINGRLLAQTAVTLNATTVTKP